MSLVLREGDFLCFRTFFLYLYNFQYSQKADIVAGISAGTLISSDDVNDVLDALDELYLDLLDIDQEPTPESREVETRRDCIHWDNTH